MRLCGASVGASGLVVEYRTRNFHIADANLNRVICKQLTHYMLRPTHPPTLDGTGNE